MVTKAVNLLADGGVGVVVEVFRVIPLDACHSLEDDNTFLWLVICRKHQQAKTSGTFKDLRRTGAGGNICSRILSIVHNIYPAEPIFWIQINFDASNVYLVILLILWPDECDISFSNNFFV